MCAVCMQVSTEAVSMRMCAACVQVFTEARGALDSLKLELQAVVSHLTWVLKNKHGYLGTASAHTCEPAHQFPKSV